MGEDLLAQRHRTSRRLGWMESDRTLESGHVVVEQPAMLDDAARDLALTGGERREGDVAAPTDLVENREIGRGEDTEILAVLAVDAFDTFGHHELDAGAHLSVRRLLAGGTFPAPFAADRGDETAALHGAARNRKLVAALEPQVGEVA